MRFGSTETSGCSSDDTHNLKSGLAWEHLPRLRQHCARVTLEDGCYVVEFDGGPSTQGYDKAEALYMAEDALATLADRHPANYNAKFIGDDAIVVWELLLQREGK